MMLLQERQDLQGCVEVFKMPQDSPELITENGIRLLLAMYIAPPTFI